MKLATFFVAATSTVKGKLRDLFNLNTLFNIIWPMLYGSRMGVTICNKNF